MEVKFNHQNSLGEPNFIIDKVWMHLLCIGHTTSMYLKYISAYKNIVHRYWDTPEKPIIPASGLITIDPENVLKEGLVVEPYIDIKNKPGMFFFTPPLTITLVRDISISYMKQKRINIVVDGVVTDADDIKPLINSLGYESLESFKKDYSNTLNAKIIYLT
jgi:hypothetical protein